jgi:hypothetical protein
LTPPTPETRSRRSFTSFSAKSDSSRWPSRPAEDDGEEADGGEVELLHDRVFDVDRQQRPRERDLVAHLLDLDVDVVAEGELEVEAREALRRGRGKVPDALDRVDLLLEDLRDLALHRLRRRAAQLGDDHREGEVDVGSAGSRRPSEISPAARPRISMAADNRRGTSAMSRAIAPGLPGCGLHLLESPPPRPQRSPFLARTRRRSAMPE